MSLSAAKQRVNYAIKALARLAVEYTDALRQGTPSLTKEALAALRKQAVKYTLAILSVEHHYGGDEGHKEVKAGDKGRYKRPKSH